MLKPNVNITITTATKTMFFDFVNHWEFSNNWEDLSAHGKIVFPKNIYVRDTKTNTRYPLFGANKATGELFKKGDKVKIESNYTYWDENLNEKKTDLTTIVDGYISNVKIEMPVTIEFEDNMYLLKKTPMQNKAYNGSQSIESILNDALQVTNNNFGTNFKCETINKTLISWDNSLLTSENETLATFLAKLKKDAFIFTYFRGNTLRVGRSVYLDLDAKTKIFEFQNNIISSDLSFKRKDDIVLSAVASNHIQEQTGTTKDGKAKVQNKRIEVLVTLQNDKVISKVVKQGDKPDPNTDGERRTFTFLEAKTENDLIRLATEALKKYYYSGLKGKFTTFGTPYVQFGDQCQIINKILPEQNGTYKIKGVEYSGGVEGMRQIIELDYKVNI
jgi:hypothetical protein